MDYLEDMIYDTKKSLSDSERKNKIEDYIYQIYESDTGIKDIYTTKSVKASRYSQAKAIVPKESKQRFCDLLDSLGIWYTTEVIPEGIEFTYGVSIGSKESKKVDKFLDSVHSNIKGGTSIMRKKRFSVKASMSAKRRVLAMTNDEFYTRDFPTMKVGEVKVKPQRGNYTVFIGLSDGTIAYQWCESKVKAEREAKYVRDTIKKYGADDNYWTKEGYKIWNPNVKSGKSVRCARTMRKRVCASNSDKEYSITLDRDSAYDLKAFLRKNHINFEPSGVGMLTHFYLGHLTSDEVRMINDYLDELNEYPIDVEDYRESLPVVNSAKSVRCARTMRRPIKASESDRKRYNVVLSRDEANELKDFLRRNRIKFDSSGYGINTYITFDLTKRESDMITDFLDAMTDHATIDVEEYFDRLPEVNSAKSIKCAESFILRDMDLEGTDDVEALRLFIRNDGDLYRTIADPTIQNLAKKMAKGTYRDDLAVKAWQYLADAGVKKYDKEVVGGVGSLKLIPKSVRTELAEALMRDYTEHVKFQADRIRKDRGIESSTSIKCSAFDDERDIVIYYNGSKEYEGSIYGLFKFLYSIMFRDANAKVACAEYLNEFGDPLIDDPQTASASDVANVLAKEIEYEANEGELYVNINWNGGRIEIFDAADQVVTSAKSIRCEDEDAEIVEDEITEDDSDLTIDISQLELSEPYYETREDDPENPDKWVLVIGKNPERHMNYKLWYYVDSTDADLTGLDLSNPDHIDIDEESTFEDYDDIQLSSDVSCCGDGRYSAGLVTM